MLNYGKTNATCRDYTFSDFSGGNSIESCYFFDDFMITAKGFIKYFSSTTKKGEKKLIIFFFSDKLSIQSLVIDNV